MKILLINNNTLHLDSLKQQLVGHEVEMQIYKPGLDFHDKDKDLIILSGGGGEGLEIYDEHKPGQLWYQDQMNFVRSTDKPILGICMGFEVIACAYGAKIIQTPVLTQGYLPVSITKAGQSLFSDAQLVQYESHYWRVNDVSNKKFKILADSPTGIEVIEHRQKPIFASQFHPEKGGSIKLSQLLSRVA